jgi:hypothetical protein
MATFNTPIDVVPGTLAKSSDINNLDAATAAAFALLPTNASINAGTINYAVDSGTANVYAVALQMTATSLPDGLSIVMKPANANTGACTLNVDSLGAVSIKTEASADPSANDIVAGVPVELRYSSTTGYFHIIKSSAAASTAAAASAAAAAVSAAAAASSASSASGYATNASASASAAAASELAASGSEAAALASENAAAASEAAALASETAAGLSETAAAASESAASASELAAAASESAAAGSAVDAAASETATATLYDNFDDRYLGAKASDPTLDNDGNALLTGAMYFSTTEDAMKVYDGATWQVIGASLGAGDGIDITVALGISTISLDLKANGGLVIETGKLALDLGASSITGTLDVPDGGTGRATGTTAYGLIAAGTTATGAHQTLAAGLATEMLIGGGESALPVWTAATGTGSPVRAQSPTFSVGLTSPLVNLSASSNQLVFQSGGVTGTISWTPASTNKKITLPNGTTDFTLTGGTSQVLMQATAGGAFTVAQLAASNLSNGVTGTSGGVVLATGATITTPTINTPDINGGTADSLTSFSIRDTSAAFDVTIAAVSSVALTAGRTLTLDMVNGARSVKLAGDIDIAGDLTTSGAYSLTMTLSNTTAITFPTSGTLVSSVTTANGVSATNTAGALSFTLGAITPTTVNGLTLSSATAGCLRVATAANTVGDLAVGLTTQILVGGGAGTVPAWGTDLPTAVTIGGAYVYRAGGTDVAVADGGTGVSTLTTAYGLLAAGTTATGNVQTLAAGLTTQILVGGGAAALPAWGTDIPTAVTIGAAYIYRAAGTDVPVTDGGTGVSTLADGGLVIGNAGSAVEVVAAGLTTQILVGGGALTAPVWGTDIPTAVTIGAKYIYRADGTDVPIADGGTGRSTSTTAYGLIAAGTTATGALQTLAVGLATQILVGGGVTALPAWGTDIPTAVTIGSAYIYRVSGTDVAVADGGTGLSSGTSGGILGYTAAGTIASSVALTDSVLVVGGGAGATPTPLADGLGATTEYLRGNAAGEPTWETLTKEAVAGLTTASSPEFVTVKLTGLTDGYIPYHVSDAAGLANTNIFTNATMVLIGDTANAKMTQGLTINQGAADDEILSLKSSDVGHPFTTATEADTYAKFNKENAALGGVRLSGFSDGDGIGLVLAGYMGTTNPTDTYPAVCIIGVKSDGGTGSAALAATEAVLRIQNSATDLLFVLGSGNVGIGCAAPASLLELQGGLTTTGAVFTLGTKETTVAANDVLGRINFYAPLEADGSDAILPGASIAAIATGTFGAASNATALHFQTGNSETAVGQTRLYIGPTGGVCVGGTTDPGDNNLYVVGNIGIGVTASATFPLMVKGIIAHLDETGLPAEASGSNGFLISGYNATGAVMGRMYLGDGSGYSVHMSKRIGSTTTDLHTFKDNGRVYFDGGVAIGHGASGTDPGDNNLLVDGTLKVDGNIGIWGSAVSSNHAIYGIKSATDPANGNSGMYLSLEPTYTGAESVSEAFYGQDIAVYPIVNAGHTNSGGIQGVYCAAFRNANGAAADDGGTLTALNGCRLLYGNYNTNAAATPATTSVRGILLNPYGTTGTITNLYDIAVDAVSLGGTITNHYGYYFTAQAGAGTLLRAIHIGALSGTQTNKHGIFIDAMTGASTTNYGIQIGDVSGATNNYSIYTGAGDVRLGGAVTLTSTLHTDGAATLASIVCEGTCNPDATDSGVLGDTSHQWSDLFLASGGVINWDNGDITLTHVASNILRLAGDAATEFSATGNITAYYSDERLKVIDGDIENALEKVLSLHGFHYHANEVAEKLGYTPVPDVGLSAQQVLAILPEAVTKAPVSDEYLTIRYDRLIPLLVQAIKELAKEIRK